MFSIGKTNPERMIWGMMKNAAGSMACCWFREIVEMNRPRPRVVSMKIGLRPNSSQMLPLTGTPNPNTATATTTAISTTPMRKKGRSLPRMSSWGRTGVTMSCSMVPSSFSLTMPSDVSIMVMIIKTIASTPGIMKFRLRSSGLYQTRTWGSTPGGFAAGQAPAHSPREDNSQRGLSPVDVLVHSLNPVDSRLKRKIAGSRELGDKIPACPCRIAVAEDDRDIADVQVGGIPEEEKLEEGREETEKEK